MDVEPTDDLTPWGVRLDEPAPAKGPHRPPPAAEGPPPLTLLSREVAGRDFHPRLRLGGDRE
jgi:hypothetical protein